jgi:hypothetical protein
MRSIANITIVTAAALCALAVACSSGNPAAPVNDAGTMMMTSCSNPPTLTQADYCKSCVASTTESPSMCTVSRSINACCAWVQAPTQEVKRSSNLHYFSSPNTTVDLGCLSNPGTVGTPQMVTLTGFVKLFSSGQDSAGVKIEIHKEGPNGTLGDLVGSAATTSSDDTADPAQMPLVTWLTKCQAPGCKFRSFTYANVPTETPLIIHTSDAAGAGLWSDLYDYNIYFANGVVDAMNQVHYDPSAVASTDLNTVASAAGGFTIKTSEGLIAGEVHDCGDVRLSGAMVDIDQAHEGPMFYFTDNEADPLPDQTRGPGGQGTSVLGLFGALNIATGSPVRLSAVGKYQGQDVLLGTYVVQVYPGAVTALSLRGRRPWQ